MSLLEVIGAWPMKSSHPSRCPRRTYPDTLICLLTFFKPFCLLSHFPIFSVFFWLTHTFMFFRMLVNEMLETALTLTILVLGVFMKFGVVPPPSVCFNWYRRSASVALCE